MSFAAPLFLIGCAGALILALLLVVAGLRTARARATFGDAPRIASLVTHEAATRRAWKGVLLVGAAGLVLAGLHFAGSRAEDSRHGEEESEAALPPPLPVEPARAWPVLAVALSAAMMLPL